jgi:predicted amidohydrolase
MRPADLPGHGHTAVIAPDGRRLAAAGDKGERLLVVELDLSQAGGGEAARRHSHPLFREFWDTGVAILAQTADERAARGLSPGNDTGRKPGEFKHAPGPQPQSLISPEAELKIAAAQMACSRHIDDNVAKIVEMIQTAAAHKTDVVVFPELALTGALAEDVRAASQSDIERALAAVQRAAGESQIYVVCGLPWQEGPERYNSAVVIDPQGKLLTRYDQIVVGRSDLFTGGRSTKAMWFEIKGVPSVVTVGRDALWSEIAEMAALRGAQVHLHLAYDRETSEDAQLRRNQLWVNIASFNTFTATVNAASPEGLASPSAPAAGGSAIWEDFRRNKAGAEGGYFPHSAVRLSEAGRQESIIYAVERVASTNPQFARMTALTRNPQMTPWYAAGVRAIFSDAGE